MSKPLSEVGLEYFLHSSTIYMCSFYLLKMLDAPVCEKDRQTQFYIKDNYSRKTWGKYA